MPKLVIFFIGLVAASCESKQEGPSEVTVTPKEQTKSTIKSTESPDSIMTILFFGNSLTAGYGLDETEAFPYLIQTRIDSLGLPYQVVNGGLSGETTAGGKGRIDWVLRSPVDIFVLELGANDMLRGLDLSETDKNLRAILDKVRKANARTKIVIAGMQAPPNMGKDYQDNFAAIFGQVAKDYDASLIPFLLAGLEGKGLDIGDGKHPNAEGQLIVMENVWSTLKDLL